MVDVARIELAKFSGLLCPPHGDDVAETPEIGVKAPWSRALCIIVSRRWPLHPHTLARPSPSEQSLSRRRGRYHRAMFDPTDFPDPDLVRQLSQDVRDARHRTHAAGAGSRLDPGVDRSAHRAPRTYDTLARRARFTHCRPSRLRKPDVRRRGAAVHFRRASEHDSSQGVPRDDRSPQLPVGPHKSGRATLDSRVEAFDLPSATTRRPLPRASHHAATRLKPDFTLL